MDNQQSLASDNISSPDTAYLRVLRERWWVIVVCVVAVIGAAMGMSYRQTPQYRATAEIVREQASLESVLFGSQFFTSWDPSRELLTAASSITVEDVAVLVKEELGSERTTEELGGMVTATAAKDSDVISVSAVSASADEAGAVANAFARQFIAYRTAAAKRTVALARQVVEKQLGTMSPVELSSDLGQLLVSRMEQLAIVQELQTGGYTLSQAARIPTTPFAPQPFRNGLLALAVGLVLGAGLVFLLDYLDKRAKDEDALETGFGLPVLAGIPRFGGKWGGGVKGRRHTFLVKMAADSSTFEPFRALRSTLRYFRVDKEIKSILVTSGLPSEGKTVTAVNLALSMALSGQNAVIIEADLRRPMVAEYLGVKTDVGLSTVLVGGVPLKDALQPVRLEDFRPQGDNLLPGEGDIAHKGSLYCLAAGPLPPNPAEFVNSARMEELLREMGHSTKVDYLVIDTPPVLAVADALALAPHVDAVIVTARVNATTLDEAREVRNRLNRIGAHVIGIVAVGVRARRSYYYRGASYG